MRTYNVIIDIDRTVAVKAHGWIAGAEMLSFWQDSKGERCLCAQFPRKNINGFYEVKDGQSKGGEQ